MIDHSVSFSGCRRARHPQFEGSVGSAFGKVQVGERKYMSLMLQNVVQSRGALVTSGFWIGRKLILPDYPMLILLLWRNYRSILNPSFMSRLGTGG